MSQEHPLLIAQSLAIDIERVVGKNGNLSIPDLTWYIRQKRNGKEIICEEVPLLGSKGFCYSCSDRDVIYINSSLYSFGPEVVIATYCHEATHIIRNCAPHYDKTYEEIKQNIPVIAHAMNRDGDYDTFEEDIAETVASLLAEPIEKFYKGNWSLSLAARRLFGYQE